MSSCGGCGACGLFVISAWLQELMPLFHSKALVTTSDAPVTTTALAKYNGSNAAHLGLWTPPGAEPAEDTSCTTANARLMEIMAC